MKSVTEKLTYILGIILQMNIRYIFMSAKSTYRKILLKNKLICNLLIKKKRIK